MSSLKLAQSGFNKFLLTNVCRNVTAVRYMASEGSADKPTHTGQQWDNDDYRLVRFINAPKHVNPNWAIDLIDEIPPKECKERVVWCDGGSGATGHPKDKPGNHACGYCGLRFFKSNHH